MSTPVGAPYARSSTASRSATGSAASACWKAIAMCRSCSDTHSTSTPAAPATAAAIEAALSPVSSPLPANHAASRATMAPARSSLPCRIPVAIRAASADLALKGAMPFPQRYIRPGLAGSLTRTPAAARSSSRVMNSSPNSGRMPASTAFSAKTRYTLWS